MKPYIIYKHSDGLYHVRCSDGFDLCNGMFQPVVHRFAACLASYLQYLSVPFVMEIDR